MIKSSWNCRESAGRSRTERKLEISIITHDPISRLLIIRIYMREPCDSASYCAFKIGTLWVQKSVVVLALYQNKYSWRLIRDRFMTHMLILNVGNSQRAIGLHATRSYWGPAVLRSVWGWEYLREGMSSQIPPSDRSFFPCRIYRTCKIRWNQSVDSE